MSLVHRGTKAYFSAKNETRLKFKYLHVYHSTTTNQLPVLGDSPKRDDSENMVIKQATVALNRSRTSVTSLFNVRSEFITRENYVY